MGSSGLVLVTGGGGYVAGFCILQLLSAGFEVRATLRDLDQQARVRKALALDGVRGGGLTFVRADLTEDAGWPEAARGCRFALHVASPVPARAPASDTALLTPAREGTLRVLRAARAEGVGRVVVTSSTAAIAYGAGRAANGRTFTEADWTDPTHPDTNAYVRSKTLAERAVWAFADREAGDMELCVINPGAVLGPVLSADFSASIEIVRKLLDGSLPGLPRFGFPIVDVRDLAQAHVSALTAPGASGQRLLAAGPFLWMSDIAAILHDRLGSQATRAPKRPAPDWLVRTAALFDPVARSALLELGIERRVSSEKAAEILGWRPRPVEETIVATAQTLISKGLVKGSAT